MAQKVQSISNDPASNMHRGARAALGGMMVNVVLAAAKISAGLFGNSYVLIADGIESALDVALTPTKSGKPFDAQSAEATVRAGDAPETPPPSLRRSPVAAAGHAPVLLWPARDGPDSRPPWRR